MDTTPQMLAILGPIGIIFAFAVKEFFSYLKSKKIEHIYATKEACDLKHQRIDENILLIKENHLKHLESDVKEINAHLQAIEIAIVRINALMKK